MRRTLLAIGLLLATAPVFAKMQAKPVEWSVGKDYFSGYVVYDDASKAKKQGLVMVPDWYGVSDSAVEKAKHIAGTDYVVLVTDVYGTGVRPTSNEEALAQVKKLNADDAGWSARINKAVDMLNAHAGSSPLDASKIGAFGYCFGGSTVLELARSGADIAGAVTFHGGLGTPMPAKAGAIKASVLVLNGADDQGTAGDIAGFQQEMNEAGADWQFVNFSGAVHCFALPTANRPGCMYNERAANRSEVMMRNFFAERFAAN